VRYTARPPVERKVDPFRGILPRPVWLSSPAVGRCVCSRGPPPATRGGYTQVKDCVREMRPRPAPRPVVRFETPPGHQGQVDFAEFRLPWGKRYALLGRAGYSRLLWLQFYTRQTMLVLMRGLEDALRLLRRPVVPAELLFDQLKAVSSDDERAIGGRLLEERRVHAFARTGLPHPACRPYRARTKGKVERPVSYVRQSFFYGRASSTNDDLNAQRCRVGADGERAPASDHGRGAAAALRTRRAWAAAALGGAPVPVAGRGEQACPSGRSGPNRRRC